MTDICIVAPTMLTCVNAKYQQDKPHVADAAISNQSLDIGLFKVTAAPYIMLTTAKAIIKEHIDGNRREDGYTNAYHSIAAHFSRAPANTTLTAVGASVWASGNQVWNGKTGNLTAKPPSSRKNINAVGRP